MMKNVFLASATSLSAIIATGPLAVSARANPTLGIDFSPGAPAIGPDSLIVGWSFTVDAPVAIIGLGDWAGAAPFSQDQQVGLWNSSGQLIASTYVTNSDTVVGSAPWIFASITPVNLVVGQTYTVGAAGGAYYTGEGDITSVTTDPSITFDANLFIDNGGGNTPLLDPTTTEILPEGESYGWFGGNVELEPVPEPASFALLGAGLGVLGLIRRRRV